MEGKIVADLKYCTREKLKVPRGERYELCRSVHAESKCYYKCRTQ